MATKWLSLLFLSTWRAQSKELPQVYHDQTAGTSPGSSSSMDVAQLNRHIFTGNVLQPMGGGVEQWVVLFCPKWFQPCQKLEPLFHDFARTWQQKQNTDSAFIRVRFAQVDCAVDKALCNQQHVTTYPFVAIYRAGQQLHTRGINWKQDTSKQMEQLLEQLVFPAEAEASEVSTESLLPKFLESFYEHRAMDVVLTLAALAVSVQFMRSNCNFLPSTDAARQPPRAPTIRSAPKIYDL